MNRTDIMQSSRQRNQNGYKHSEVGIIPVDWEVVQLSQCLKRAPTYGINAPAIPFDSRFPTYLRITDITEEGRFAEATKASVEHSASVSYLLEVGDIVFARTGASVGKSYLYNPQDGCLVFAGFLIRLSPNPDQLIPAYLRFFAQSQVYWHWVKVNSMRSGQPGINGREYASLPIPLPTLTEQHAIAEVLGDADALIESLEQLIAKKRAVKQGVMQELFHPKVEWVATKLGSLGVFLKGSGVRKDDTQSGDIPCIRYGEIYTKHSDYIKAFYSWISPAVASTARRLKVGDVLFAGSGETKEEIGKCVAFVDDVVAYAGGDIVILRPEKVCALFLGYYLNTAPINRQKASRGQGDAVVHIGSTALADIDLTLPPTIAEQTAIAAILSDMDEEIAALETKLTKARMVKQGMMQELLTGRVRLV